MLRLDLLSGELKKRRSPIRKSSYRIIADIYSALSAPSDNTIAAVNAWERVFRFLYGGGQARREGNVILRAEKLFGEYSLFPEKDCVNKAFRLLIFSVQTYYSLLVKHIMAEILNGIRCGSQEPFSHSDIILGGFAERFGISGYAERDMYCWPLFELDNGFGGIMDRIRADIGRFRDGGGTAFLATNSPCDHIRQIYEALLPKELRHALGEYYTPDWLAELTLDTALGFCEKKDIKEITVTDPTCGSGTFLMQAIAKKKLAGCGAGDIISTVAGVDINPLAVLTAKTNYLIMLSDMLADMPEGKRNISVPVYRADILTVFSDACDAAYTDISAMFPAAAPISQGKKISADGELVRSLAKADIITGNPPWVNWEYLPEEYRRGTERLWTEYGLFTAKGRERSFAKEDVSVLITCAVIDRLLKDGGVIGFVTKQSIFKSARNGASFRRFSVRGSQPYRVLRADDLSGLTVFGGAINKTALLFARKGRHTVYPVPYYLWRKRSDAGRGTFGSYSRLADVRSRTYTVRLSAFPSVRNDISSPWSTAEPDAAQSLGNVLGSNPYRARTGIFTGGANAVYYLRINSSNGSFVSVTNITDRAKRKTETITAPLEKDHIYPLLRGGNVSRWSASYDTYILCPHDSCSRMLPIPRDRLRAEAPASLSYLEHFRAVLDARKGFAGWEKKIQEREFHALLRIGDYTFSPYKVVWRYIADDFICAVIGSADDPYLGRRLVLPNEKLMYISTDSEAEAYYLCGLLSSTPVSRCVRSYMTNTSISAHVLDKLYIPAFDPADERHNAVSELCREGHKSPDALKAAIIGSIDIIARDIYGLEV